MGTYVLTGGCCMEKEVQQLLMAISSELNMFFTNNVRTMIINLNKMELITDDEICNIFIFMEEC